MQSLRVRDLMTPKPHTLGDHSNLAEVSDLMQRAGIRHVLIEDEHHRLVGLVSHRDLLGKALGGGQDLPASIRRPYLQAIPVAEIMVRSLATIAATDTVHEAANRMLHGHLGCLPVVEQGRAIGIITSSDFVRYVADLQPGETQ